MGCETARRLVALLRLVECSCPAAYGTAAELADDAMIDAWFGPLPMATTPLPAGSDIV